MQNKVKDLISNVCTSKDMHKRFNSMYDQTGKLNQDYSKVQDSKDDWQSALCDVPLLKILKVEREKQSKPHSIDNQ